MNEFDYNLKDTREIITPALIYYTDLIGEHVKKIISMAGGADRLWPHIKSHKTRELILLMQNYDITRIKCATISEAELAASSKASHVLLAYPLIGPNIRRFLKLMEAFPDTVFWAVGDDVGSLKELGTQAHSRKMRVNVLVDVDMGMHRTGVTTDRVVDFYRECQGICGLELKGLHCYDGNRHEPDPADRMALALRDDSTLKEIREQLEMGGYDCGTVVIGGSPSFPCHLSLKDVYYSPGTIFINDYGYSHTYRDLEFVPAAAVMTRVISRPGPGRFTLDLGYKGIAADPVSPRGKIVGLDHVREVFQNEEHWAFSMEGGFEGQCPSIGDVLYVIPTHICPTSALYPEILTALGGEITGSWRVAARDRKVTY